MIWAVFAGVVICGGFAVLLLIASLPVDCDHSDRMPYDDIF